MHMIELHILQSFPVTCLNRDDVGAPKTAYFGGCQRARVSSQSWKRAIRETMNEEVPEISQPLRGHFLADKITQALIRLGLSEDQSVEAGEELATFLGKKNTKFKDGHKTDVALFFSPGEIEAISQAAKTQIEENKKLEIKKGALKKAIDKAQPMDIRDIAVFGRMVATDHTLMLEGAGLFSHALSTHSVSNEIDFFSAVDDMKPKDAEGAGHIGTLEFSSACYYRYVGLNLDLLKDEAHLGHFSEEELKKVVETFLYASIMAVPEARKNSMFGINPPEYVLGINRTGQPLSLVNAFEKPIHSKDGYISQSIEALNAKWTNLEATYCLKDQVKKQVKMPEKKLNTFLNELTGEL